MSGQPIAIIVDHSKSFLMYLSILLKRMNLDVLPVDNAAEAMALARVTSPHLMTLDMALPGVDGLSALRSLRADELLCELPVIMTVSNQSKHAQWEALSLDCIDVLAKPLDLRRLHKAIQRCDLYSGGRRRYLRAAFSKSVRLTYGLDTRNVKGVTLSERGIFVRVKSELPKNASVEISLPLPEREILKLNGKVIYSIMDEDADSSVEHGLAIRFDRLTKHDSVLLSCIVTDLLIGDIKEVQTEPVVRSTERS